MSNREFAMINVVSLGALYTSKGMKKINMLKSLKCIVFKTKIILSFLLIQATVFLFSQIYVDPVSLLLSNIPLYL